MEKITIAQIARKQQPSKFKPGETYTITNVIDNRNKKLSAIGAWTENWKIGDVIECEIQEKKYIDRDGFEQTSLTMINPNKKTFTAKASSTDPNVIAFQITAAIAPLMFRDKTKNVTFEEIVAVFNKVKNELNITQQIKKDSTPVIDVAKEEKLATSTKQAIVEDNSDEDF